MGVFNKVRLEEQRAPKLSVEMIDPQIGDYIVDALTKAFTELEEAINFHKIGSAYGVMKHKVAKRIVDRIDSLLLNRFGIKFKHMATDETIYACLPAPGNNYNVLNKDIEDNYKSVEDFMRMYGKRPEDVARPDQIDTDANYIDAIIRWKESIDKLDKQLNTKGVVIDRQKAKIHNLPKDYVVFAMADFYGLFKTWELTPKEVTAILMHEVGHVFTHIEYSYRTLSNTAVLVDSLQENLVNRNRSFKKSLILAYQDAVGENLEQELEDKNVVVATITIMNRFISSHRYMQQVPHADTDSEQLADQFSGRFGLGAELVSGLHKINVKFDDIRFMYIMGGLLEMYFIVMLWSILISGPIGLIVGNIVFLALVVIEFLFGIIGDIVSYGDTTTPKTYDDNRQRLKRMRNEVIRQLRNFKIDKKAIKTMIASVDNMDKIISMTPPEKISLTSKLVRSISSKAKSYAEIKEIEQVVENVMENDLHLAANRLKTL